MILCAVFLLGLAQATAPTTTGGDAEKTPIKVDPNVS